MSSANYDGTPVEQAIIGAALIDPEALNTALEEGLERKHFSSVANSVIFNAMTEMVRQGLPVDMSTLGTYMKREDTLEKVGGYGYLSEISAEFPDLTSIPQYAQMILDDHLRRTIQMAGTSLVNIPARCTTSEDVMAHTNDVFQKIQAASAGRVSGVVTSAESVKEMLGSIEGDDRRIPTGFYQLDEYLEGLSPGGMYIVAGRPGMGKTSFALSMARNMAIRNKRIGIFSLEMSHRDLCMRLSSMESGLPYPKIRGGSRTMDAEDWKAVMAATTMQSKWKIQFSDKTSLTATALVSAAKKMIVQGGSLDLVIVDYLQLMTPGSQYAGNRVNEVSEITRQLKVAALELDVPIMALSQLNRGVEHREDKRPMLSDLRDSGSIEQDADVVIFIHTPAVQPDIGIERREAIIAKHRNGPLGTVRLAWHPETMQFRDDHPHYVPESSSPKVVSMPHKE